MNPVKTVSDRARERDRKYSRRIRERENNGKFERKFIVKREKKHRIFKKFTLVFLVGVE
jgi:hypothetical protein